MIDKFLACLFPPQEGGPEPLIQRSSQWPSVRNRHLRDQPDCQVCGTRDGVEVHHVVPVHVDPPLELAETNLLSLCRPHHLLFGHLGLWASWNGNVHEDAAVWREKIAERPLFDKEEGE